MAVEITTTPILTGTGLGPATDYVVLHDNETNLLKRISPMELLKGSGITERTIEEWDGDLIAATTDIGDDLCWLRIGQDITVSDDHETPDTMRIYARNGVKVTVATGKTLTIGSFKSETDDLVFDGDGDVILAPKAATAIRVGWWTGSSPSGDQDHALQQVFASVAYGGKVILPPQVQVQTSGSYDLPSHLAIEGDGVPEVAFPGQCSTILYTGSDYLFKAPGGFRNIRIRDCMLRGGNGTLIQVFDDTAVDVGLGLWIDNVMFVGGDYAISFEGGDSGDLEVEQVVSRSCQFTDQYLDAIRFNTINGSFSIYDPYIYCATHGSNAFHVDEGGVGQLTVYNHTILGQNADPVCTGEDNNDRDLLNLGGACLLIEGDHPSIKFVGGQDEGMKNFIVNKHANIYAIIDIDGVNVQSFTDLWEGCRINIRGGKHFALSIRERPTPGDPETPSIVTSDSVYIEATNPCRDGAFVQEICYFPYPSYSSHSHRRGCFGILDLIKDPQTIAGPLSTYGNETTPLLSVGSLETDKESFFVGQVTPDGDREEGYVQYYDSLGRHIIKGSDGSAEHVHIVGKVSSVKPVIVSDPFTGGTIDTAIWTAAGAGFSQTGGKLQLVSTDSQSIHTLNAYNLWDAQATVKADTVVSGASATQWAMTSDAFGGALYVLMDNYGGVLRCKIDGSGGPGLIASPSFDHAVHVYWRMKILHGNLSFQWSTDGLTFHTIATHKADYSFWPGMATMKFYLQHYNGDASSITSKWDDFLIEDLSDTV